ncbi:hypothetical protein Afil01_21370 [Actinorhabdospora filicis]|uniref:Uncharacterized protein n=1 Tax=Actinorhabdospora filicis TaxID=1785913 RepID=A0A9W6WA67_9ACTN|nr:hypothetical protein [Actinorhabdospora filicis]GLZ77330.1 hypothetical protein Afil01_21370 [Actinorhabdospora filicis]
MSLLDRVAASEAARDYLLWHGDFDPEATEHVEPIRLPSGTAMTPIAGDGSGGTYFLIGEAGTGGDDRPVLYADSEGGAVYLADTLSDCLELIIGLPYWHDCLRIGPIDLDEAETEYLEAVYEPHEDGARDLRDGRAAALAGLGLREVPGQELLARFHAAAIGDGELPVGPEGNSYEPLAH